MEDSTIIIGGLKRKQREILDLFKRKEPKAVFEDWPFAPSVLPNILTGISVAGEGALQSPTTLSAVRALSETAGSLPLHVFVRDGDERRRDRDHPADLVLNRRANKWSGPNGLRIRLVHDALLHGRGVAVAVRAGGKVKELHRVEPGAYSVDLQGAEPAYLVTLKDGTQKRYSWRDVVDVLTPGSTIDRPLCITHRAKNAIALDIALSRYFERLLAGGARPSTIYTPSNGEAIEPARWREIKKFIDEQMATSGDVFIPAPVEADLKQFSSVDMQTIEWAAAVRTSIAAAFRVPPVILMDYGRATWSNSAEMGQQFLQSLLPWLDSIEFAFSRVLIDDDEKNFLEHQIFELVKPNVVQLYAAGRSATGGAVITPNEWRRVALNLPPIEGRDEFVRQAGQTGAGDPRNPPDENDKGNT